MGEKKFPSNAIKCSERWIFFLLGHYAMEICAVCVRGDLYS